MVPSLSSKWFLTLVDALEEMGLARETAIAPVTKNALELRNPRFRVPLDSLEESLSIAKTALSIPNIGLEMTYRARVSTLSSTGSLLSLCATLIAACELNNDNSVLTESIGMPSLERRGNGIFMVWTPDFEDYAKYRHVSELIFVGYVITVNWLSWCFKRGVKSVSFRHCALGDTNRHEFICKCPVRFDQGEYALEFDSEFADMPLPMANARKLIEVQQVLRKALEKVAHQSELELQTFAVIVDAINNHLISRSIIAGIMGMDERTFQRRLQAEGLTYRSVLDNVRQTMCRDYIQKGMNFAEIAQLLGYNDQSAFTRAFRKWHGVIPSQYSMQRVMF